MRNLAPQTPLDWALIILAAFIIGLMLPSPVDACEPEPVTPNTPTGIAGCERWGDGTASMYGPGQGVAMNFCTWERRHSTGCGSVVIQSHQTGLTVITPVVDFCDCYLGDSDPLNDRIVDLQYGVVDALGLDRSWGLWPVTVWPADGRSSTPDPASPLSGVGASNQPAAGADGESPSPPLPDTAMAP